MNTAIIALALSLTLLLVFTAFLYLFFTFSIFFGGFYIASSSAKIKKMLDLSELQRGETLYDLGSGNGKIVIEAAKNYGAKAVGIEINPLLVLFSRRKIKKEKLQDKAKIIWGNFLKRDISDADVVIVYLSRTGNRRAEDKFLSEINPGTRIISLSFSFKTIPLEKTDNDIRLYRVPKKTK